MRGGARGLVLVPYIFEGGERDRIIRGTRLDELFNDNNISQNGLLYKVWFKLYWHGDVESPDVTELVRVMQTTGEENNRFHCIGTIHAFAFDVPNLERLIRRSYWKFLNRNPAGELIGPNITDRRGSGTPYTFVLEQMDQVNLRTGVVNEKTYSFDINELNDYLERQYNNLTIGEDTIDIALRYVDETNVLNPQQKDILRNSIVEMFPIINPEENGLNYVLK
jgi:hypothetical protein